MRICGLMFVLLSLLTLSAPSAAQAPADVSARTGDLLKLLNGEFAPEKLFAPSFLAQVPADQVKAIASQLSTMMGRATAIMPIPSPDSAAQKGRVDYDRGSATLTYVLDPQPPHLLTGLLLTEVAQQEQTPDQTVAVIRALQGRTGLVVARLGDGAPQILAAHNPDQALAIGSAFKLVILGELVRATEAGERRWNDMVTLDGSPLPGGAYTQMPAGMNVSLLELAQKMVSVSDNSAADILLITLGRAKVEGMLDTLGWKGPNRPFLSALEMFKIKGIARFRERWSSLNAAQRRALLKEIDAAPNSEVDPQLFKDGRPILIDKAEWFASPLDLVRAMDWLRRHSESGGGAGARGILSMNPGMVRGPANVQFSYVGFKGGSEPGVLTLTWLLQGRDGWYVVSGGWNDSSAAVDQARFAAIMTGLISGLSK